MQWGLTAAVRGALAIALVALGLVAALRPAAAQAPAKGKELVAVLDLDPLGASKNQAAAISERLREELLATGVYRIVDRDQMEKVLSEQALQQTGCTGQECAVQVGRILGVRKLVAGKVNRVEENLWLISCILVDAESAETVRAVSFQHEGSFSSLLSEGAGQLVAKLTSGAASPGAAAGGAVQGAQSALDLQQVPDDAEVIVDGTSKGKGNQRVGGLLPGQRELEVRRPRFRPFKQVLLLTAGQTLRVEPAFARYKLAIFPITRMGRWTVNTEAYSVGWITNALASAATQAGLTVSHSLHVKTDQNIARHGEDLGAFPDVREKAWTFFGNPDVDFAVAKAQALGADVVLYFTIDTAFASSGTWKVQLIDPKTRVILDGSGTWPFSAKSAPAVTTGVQAVLERFVASAR